MYNKLVYTLILSCLSSTILQARFDFNDIFQDMEERMHEMHKEMQKMEKSFTKQFKSIKKSDITIQPSIQETDKKVTITFKDIDTAPKQALVQDEDNQLTIKTDNQTIKVGAEKTLLSVSIDQHLKETKKENKQQSSQAFYSSSSFVKTLNTQVDLTKVIVDYDDQTKKLIIHIPMQKKVKGTEIPINIKNKKEQLDKIEKKQNNAHIITTSEPKQEDKHEYSKF